MLFDFYFAKFTSYTLYLLLLTVRQFAFGFTLDIKIRKIIQSSVLSFLGVLKVANFLLLSLSQFFLLLLGRNLLSRYSPPIMQSSFARILHQLCKVPLAISLVHNVLCGVGEYCESVPLNCTGSYVLSASI